MKHWEKLPKTSDNDRSLKLWFENVSSRRWTVSTGHIVDEYIWNAEGGQYFCKRSQSPEMKRNARGNGFLFLSRGNGEMTVAVRRAKQIIGAFNLYLKVLNFWLVLIFSIAIFLMHFFSHDLIKIVWSSFNLIHFVQLIPIPTYPITLMLCNWFQLVWIKSPFARSHPAWLRRLETP